MNQRIGLLVAGLLALSLVATGSATAHGLPDQPGTAAPSFHAHCTPAVAGGHIQVQARVEHAVRGTTFTAAATAAFTSGTTAVVLHRAGKSFVARGKLAVPAGQAAGPVTVSVTLVYGGTPTVVTCTSQIGAAGDET
jgi:hypothetical protein